MNGDNEQARFAFDTSCATESNLMQPLGLMRRSDVGRILSVRCGEGDRDVERGLLEMGFVEGACVEVLHHGFWGRDPLAVRINQTMTVALRRREANAVLVGPLLDQTAGGGLIAKQESKSS
jgi:ferrous iron transport protein A